MACRVTGSVWVLIKIPDLLFVDCDRQDLFLFKFIRMILIAFDDHEPLFFMQSDFRWHQEDLGKEILLLQ